MPITKPLTYDERGRMDAEINRLRDALKLDEMTDSVDGPTTSADHTNLLVGSTIGLAVLAVTAIITIFLARPDKDNTAIVATLMGFLVPLMTALLAAAVQQVHQAVNGRLSQLLRVTAARGRAEGMLAQQESMHEETLKKLAQAESILPATPEDKTA